jgi:hypothetical protein
MGQQQWIFQELLEQRDAGLNSHQLVLHACLMTTDDDDNLTS